MLKFEKSKECGHRTWSFFFFTLSLYYGEKQTVVLPNKTHGVPQTQREEDGQSDHKHVFITRISSLEGVCACVCLLELLTSCSKSHYV